MTAVLKEQIREALTGFGSGNLADNATEILNVLGYESGQFSFRLTLIRDFPNTFRPGHLILILKKQRLKTGSP